MTTMTNLDPEKDGIDHINIYSKGKSVIGRELSNFAHTPFIHPVYGWFASMEGFYYYISCGGGSHPRTAPQDELESIRKLYGLRAKLYGKRFQKVPINGFEEILHTGLTEKIKQNQHLQSLIRETELTFVHYYTYGSRVVIPKGSEWLVQGCTRIRQELKSGEF